MLGKPGISGTSDTYGISGIFSISETGEISGAPGVGKFAR